MKVALCGLGMMGQAHLANLGGIRDVELVALCDSDPAAHVARQPFLP